MVSKLSMLESHPMRSGLPEIFCEENYAKVLEFHKAQDGYSPTPLVRLSGLANELNVKSIFVKDEAKRLPLKSCDILGVSYAFSNLMENYVMKKPTLISVSNGNFGQALAMLANKEGCQARIFLPHGAREPAQPSDLVKIERTHLNYADAMHHAQRYAKKNRCVLFIPNSFPGYERIPGDVALGYTTMAAEAIEQLQALDIKPTHVFLQSGCGATTCGVLAYFASRYGDECPRFAIMEAEESAWLYTSVRRKKQNDAEGNPYTIMTELNCGVSDLLTYSVLHDYASYYFKCPDWLTVRGTRTLANPAEDDAPIVSGASGAVGIGLLQQLFDGEEYSVFKESMELNENSVVLFFNIEGDTDERAYRKIIDSAKCAKDDEDDLLESEHDSENDDDII